MRPGSSVLSPTVRGVAVTTPTSAGGGLAAVGSAFGAQAASSAASTASGHSDGRRARVGALFEADIKRGPFGGAARQASPMGKRQI